MKKQKIIDRLKVHYETILNMEYECVGIFLQGSQNYKLDYDESDIDSKIIVLPKFDDIVLNKKPVSSTHIMPNNEHVDIKDIRLMFECFRKQNVNFIEILFTDYYILNPKYKDIYQLMFDNAEEIAHYNNYAAISCMVGMAHEKYTALEHPYPSIAWKIETYGCDFKQYHHILRLHEFLKRFIAGESYADCLISKNTEQLIEIKKNNCTLQTAKTHSKAVIDEMDEIKRDYFINNPVEINHKVDELMNNVLVNIIKQSFLEELR